MIVPKAGSQQGVVVRGWLISGARWGKGTIVLGFQMRSFLVLTSTSPPIKQVGKLAFWGLFSTHRPHHKAPLRGARGALTRTPTPQHRRSVGSIESMSTSGKIWRFTGDYEADNGCKIS